MLADAPIVRDLQHRVRAQHFLGGDVDDGVPLDVRVVDDVVFVLLLLLLGGRRRRDGGGGRDARQAGDDAVDGRGKAHVGREVHGGHGNGVVQPLPPAFGLGRDLGQEVCEGCEEVLGDGGREAGLLGLETVDLVEGLQGFGAPALDGKEIWWGV